MKIGDDPFEGAEVRVINHSTALANFDKTKYLTGADGIATVMVTMDLLGQETQDVHFSARAFTDDWSRESEMPDPVVTVTKVIPPKLAKEVTVLPAQAVVTSGEMAYAKTYATDTDGEMMAHKQFDYQWLVGTGNASLSNKGSSNNTGDGAEAFIMTTATLPNLDPAMIEARCQFDGVEGIGYITVEPPGLRFEIESRQAMADFGFTKTLKFDVTAHGIGEKTLTKEDLQFTVDKTNVNIGNVKFLDGTKKNTFTLELLITETEAESKKSPYVKIALKVAEGVDPDYVPSTLTLALNSEDLGVGKLNYERVGDWDPLTSIGKVKTYGEATGDVRVSTTNGVAIPDGTVVRFAVVPDMFPYEQNRWNDIYAGQSGESTTIDGVVTVSAVVNQARPGHKFYLALECKGYVALMPFEVVK